MIKAAVTGGAGFIGSHLCKELLRQNFKVLCIDNLYTGSKENIEDLLPNPNFEFIKHDIVEPIMFQADQIYNLACPASPVHYQSNPVQTMKCSVLGILNLLTLAKKTNAKILHASTSEVYGDPLEHPQKESYWGHVNPLGIRACYDEGKRAAECLCMDFYREYNVQVKIVRIFNTYGPKMAINDGRVISNFLIQALKNEPITIYGDGSQTRSFQYISDLVEGMTKMMNQDDFPGPINLGNPGEYAIKELAEKAIEICGSKSKIIYKELPQDDPKKRRPDISLAREKLEWFPKIPLDEGLLKTRDYFKEKLRKEITKN